MEQAAYQTLVYILKVAPYIGAVGTVIFLFVVVRDTLNGE